MPKELPIYDINGTPISGGGTGTGFKLYNPTHSQWIFVSNDVSTRYNMNSEQIAANIAWLSQNAASVYTGGEVPPKLPNIEAQTPEAFCDLIVESHSSPDEQRNYFYAIPVPSPDGVPTYLLYNYAYGQVIFVSNVDKGGDLQVEAHKSLAESRNSFRFVPKNDGYMIQCVGGGHFMSAAGRYLFVSNDKMGGDNVVEAHRSVEDRNVFHFQFATRSADWHMH